MSNTLLNGDDFGLKIYNRFPPVYREVDEHNNFALKRYLQSISEGGFKYSIEELNGILDLVDTDTVSTDVLPLLYNQYGLEIFNGIPEKYLRYFLPFLGLAYSKKGSLGVIPFITTSLSGIRTNIDLTYDEYGNPTMTVTLDMDYQAGGGNFFPKPDQLNRILKNFLPFYIDCVLNYQYSTEDTITLSVVEQYFRDKLVPLDTEQNSVTNTEESNDVISHTFEDTSNVYDKVNNDNQFCWILNDDRSILNSCTIINLDLVDTLTYVDDIIGDSEVMKGVPTYFDYIILLPAQLSSPPS